MDLALIPAVSGDFGVMPGHVPTVAELRPGVVQVHKELDKEVEKYFVSGGFAVAHADSSVEVTVVEAAKLEDLDPAAVKSGLAEYTARCAIRPRCIFALVFGLGNERAGHVAYVCPTTPCCQASGLVLAFAKLHIRGLGSEGARAVAALHVHSGATADQSTGHRH